MENIKKGEDMREIKLELELLDRIYQDLLMIKETIIRIKKIQENNDTLEKSLKEILVIYQNLIQSVIGMMNNRKKNVKGLGLGEKIATYMSIKINLKECKNIHDILNIVIQDIIIRNEDIEKIKKEYPRISKTIINLCNRIEIANAKCIKILKNE